MNPKEIISKFDEYLATHNLSFEAIVIGGAALALLKIITRETQDCDILDPKIPPDIAKASKDFVKTLHKQGHDIKENWFNNGPEDLKKSLPKTWKSEIQLLFKGKVLTLFTLGRMDLLRAKLFAYCDRQQDLQDCIALFPTQEELQQVLEWLQTQDANPDWPNHVQKSLSFLAKELGYEF